MSFPFSWKITVPRCLFSSSAQREWGHQDLCQYSAFVGASAFCSFDISSTVEICTAVFCRKVFQFMEAIWSFHDVLDWKINRFTVAYCCSCIAVSIPCLCMTFQVTSLWCPWCILIFIYCRAATGGPDLPDNKKRCCLWSRYSRKVLRAPFRRNSLQNGYCTLV
jgi:hypothetical protein